MRKIANFVFLALTIGLGGACQNSVQLHGQWHDSIVKIEMKLSAFGVESDDFPSIDAYIDFEHDSSNCITSYYNPKYKGSAYRLTSNEMKGVLALLQNCNLEKLKKDYKVELSDQPTSTTVIYTTYGNFTFIDYGMKGDYPLQALYKMVYKLSY